MSDILSILKFIFICVEVVLLFNLMIVVHELGHFLAARWRGLKVEKFAIWFGKAIWSKTINGVEYRLGSIPAGGYVAIPQLAPMEMMEGHSETDRSQLPPVKPIDKIIVAAAGPAFSLGLALVFAVTIWIIGRPVGEGELSTVVGFIEPEGPAAKANMQLGDKILSVNGHPVTRFAPTGNAGESIVWNVIRSESPIIPVKIERAGQVLTVDVEPVVPKREGWGRKRLKQIGIYPAQTPRIATILAHSPAAQAGLQSQDLIIAANGKKLLFPTELATVIKETGTKPMTLTVDRKGHVFDVTVTPRVPDKGGQAPIVGIGWDDRGVTKIAHPTPWEQIAASVNTMWATITAIASPKSGISIQHLSGPVGIMNVYYRIFESPDGWRDALWFSVILNVNLALMNLLPIPVLDGGHITLAIIEGIRRRPINIRLLEIVQSTCALVIIGFILYVSFYDVLDLPWSKRAPQEKPVKVEFTAPSNPTPGQ